MNAGSLNDGNQQRAGLHRLTCQPLVEAGGAVYLEFNIKIMTAAQGTPNRGNTGKSIQLIRRPSVGVFRPRQRGRFTSPLPPSTWAPSPQK